MNIKMILSLLALLALSCGTSDLPASASLQAAPTSIAVTPASTPSSAPAAQPASMEVAEALPMESPSKEEAEFQLVISALEVPLLSLGEFTGEDSALTNRYTWLSRSSLFAVLRGVELSKLAAEHRAWVGQRVTLFEDDGNACDTRVTGVSILAQVNVFNEETQKKNAPELYELAKERGGLRLVAQVEPVRCRAPKFARLSSMGAPMMLTYVAASSAQTSAALKKLRALPEYKVAQREYREYRSAYAGLPKTLEEYGSSPNVYLFVGGGRTLLFATQQNPGGCGDFDSAIWGLWEVGADESLSLFKSGVEFLNPELLLDINGDGTLEIFDHGLWQESRGSYEMTRGVVAPDEEDVCPC